MSKGKQPFSPRANQQKYKFTPGQRFGRLVVEGETYYHCPSGECKRLWICRCDCGETLLVHVGNLVRGKSKSCGCLRFCSRNAKHGRSQSSEYHVWQGMKSRCNNPKNTRYGDYGGRGITICDRW